jgi:hypothetical protein
MSDPFVIALFALGLSVIASAVRMIDWFIHSDPKLVARAARLAVVAVAVLSVPLLAVLLVKEQWTAATALGAAMILVGAFAGSRMLRWINIRPLVPDRSVPPAATVGGGLHRGAIDDPDLVRQAATILEAYLLYASHAAQRGNGHLPAIEGGAGAGRAGTNGHAKEPGPEAMSEEEALAVLGLEEGATSREIGEAHERIAQRIGPDGGGSPYLAAKVDVARDVLLRGAGKASLRITAGAAPKRRSTPRRPRERPPT